MARPSEEPPSASFVDASASFRDQLTAGEEVIDPATFAGSIPAINGVAPRIRIAPSVSWWVWSLLLFLVITTLSLFQIDVSARVLVVSLSLEAALVLLWNLTVLFKGGPGPGPVDSFTWSALNSGSLPFAIIFGVNRPGFSSA